MLLKLCGARAVRWHEHLPLRCSVASRSRRGVDAESHLVWSVRARRRLLVGPVEPAPVEALVRIAERTGVHILALPVVWGEPILLFHGFAAYMPARFDELVKGKAALLEHRPELVECSHGQHFLG
jgi:hypothetical protein